MNSFHHVPDNRTQMLRRIPFLVFLNFGLSFFAPFAMGQEAGNRKIIVRRSVSRTVLTEPEWRSVETAVDKGLTYLIRQQKPDGMFQRSAFLEPGVSGLCVMAFMSRGHLPGQGPYGENLNISFRFLMGCQRDDGLLTSFHDNKNSVYSHAICALVLSELYGVVDVQYEAKLRKTIEKAIVFTSHRYSQPKRHEYDHGSWRYLTPTNDQDGDLSVTSWNLFFLRSAKNAGFEVDVTLIDDAVAYLKRLYDPVQSTFRYSIPPAGERTANNARRAMAGAGILSMSLAGEHYSDFAQNASNTLLKQPLQRPDYAEPSNEYMAYTAFYCSMAMFHMGGEYWEEFYPQLARMLVKEQRADGSWIVNNGRDQNFGVSYMTALSILALTPPYQMLPIFQR